MPGFFPRLLTAAVLAVVFMASACAEARPDNDRSATSVRSMGLVPSPAPGGVTSQRRETDPPIPSALRGLRPFLVRRPFVSACRMELCVSGVTFHLYGASVFGNLGSAESSIRLARAAGINTLRITNFLYEFDPVRDAAYRERDWLLVDEFIAAARRSHMHVILDLSTYRNLLRHNGMNPYARNWGPWLRWVANRTNSVTGERYSDDPTIAMISLAGEPEPVAANSDPLAATSTRQLTAFYVRTARQLRSVDRHHIISSGGLLQYGWDSGVNWRAIFKAVDLCAVHGFSPLDRLGLPRLVSYCRGLGKPWIVEEFGFLQSLGDGERADAFRAVYRLAKSYGAAGIAFWNLGPEVDAGSHDVNPATPRTFEVVARHAPI